MLVIGTIRRNQGEKAGRGGLRGEGKGGKPAPSRSFKKELMTKYVR